MSYYLPRTIDLVMKYVLEYFPCVKRTQFNEKSSSWPLMDICAHSIEIQSWDYIYPSKRLSSTSRCWGDTIDALANVKLQRGATVSREAGHTGLSWMAYSSFGDSFLLWLDIWALTVNCCVFPQPLTVTDKVFIKIMIL